MWRQRVFDYDGWLGAGGWPPAHYEPDEHTVVIALMSDDGRIAWASFAQDDVPVEDRIAPGTSLA